MLLLRIIVLKNYLKKYKIDIILNLRLIQHFYKLKHVKASYLSKLFSSEH